MSQLPGEARDYKANDWGDIERIEKSCIAPRSLQLKIDAQVILLKNIDESLVNGSLGRVIGFVGEYNGEQVPLVRFLNGRERAMSHEEWKIEMPGGAIIATRRQVYF
jgi:ATP-dependent DNA helicase PIF1